MLLLSLLFLFVGNPQQGAPAKTPAPTTTKPPLAPSARYTVTNDDLWSSMTLDNLTPLHLEAEYRQDVRIAKLPSPNANSLDTLFEAQTAADRFQFIRNNLSIHLLNASFTSQRVSFSKGIRVGSTKAAFCKAFKMDPKYDIYEVKGDFGPGLTFYFQKGLLSRVECDF